VGVVVCGLFLLPHPARAEGHGPREVKVRVAPSYPEIARRMHLGGKVRLQVTVAADGRVKQTHALGGHPILVDAATAAVKSWRFAPGPAETTESVEFDFRDPDGN
jgi:TonB family protein